ncbi:TPA: DUF4222 domain-containing protein [Escherichia coli]|nr:DUF4222 domain-containing protein [Escherichia coli]
MKKKISGFTASGPARPEIRPDDIFKDKYGGRITIKTVDDFRVTYIRPGVWQTGRRTGQTPQRRTGERGG